MFFFAGNRNEVREAAVAAALEELLGVIDLSQN
jgi:nicotinamide mononucleotide (NMN) deamidase PncC